MNLFQGNYKNVEPLAYKLRPKTLDDFVGQEKLLGKDGIIRKLILNSTLSNSIFMDHLVVEKVVWVKSFQIHLIVILKN